MKKGLKKGLLALALGLSLSVAGIGFALQDEPTVSTASAVGITSEEIKDAYGVGTTLIMPETVTGEDGQTFENGILVFPDGTAHTGSEIALTEVGTYKVRYSLTTENGVVKAEKQFNVSQKNWTLSSTNSSATYSEELEAVKYNDPNGAKASGLVLSLAAGDKFTYNKPLDLSDTTLGEVIRLNPTLGEDYGFTLNEKGQRNYYVNTPVAEYCYVTFTDCYNPDVYVKLAMRFVTTNGQPYFRVGSGNQEEVGLRGPETTPVASSQQSRSVYIDGVLYLAWLQKYGAEKNLGTYISEKNAGYGWKLEYESQRWTAANGGAFSLVNILNSEDIYGSNLFKGFTTGEVYVSIECDNYLTNKNARVELVNIGHDKGEGLKEVDTADLKAPIITLEEKVATAANVYCAVGDAFPIPEAKAVDISLVDEVKAKVYKNYGTQKQTEVLVTDGKFTPNAAAVYTIVYSAEDASGNITQRPLNVTAFNADDGKSIALEVDKLSSISAGETATLPAYSLKGYNGGTQLKIFVSYGDEKQEIDLDNMQFTPLHVGEYKIIYEYRDIFFSYSDEYTVNSLPSETIDLIEEIIMPKYFIKGYKYSLDSYHVYSFKEKDPTPLTADVFVSFDDGEFKKIEDVGEVEITGSQTATFQYRYDGVDIGEPIAVPIVDVVGTHMGEEEEETGLWMFKYFKGDFSLADTAEKDMRFNAVNNAGNQTLSFINPISAANFRFGFSIPEGADNFSALRIVLTDYYDPTNKTVISYEKSDDLVYFSIDDGEKIVLKKEFAGKESKTVYYDSANSLMDYGEGRILYDFDFISDKCYLDVVLENCNGATAIVVKQVGNTLMRNSNHTDKYAPVITVYKDRGDKLVNTEMTVYAAEILDVLSPVLNKNITVSVTDPDGKTVVSKDGVELGGKLKTADGTRDYVIELTKKGLYTIVYAGKDEEGKNVQTQYTVNVYNNAPPVVKFDKGYTADTVIKAQEGEFIYLPKYTVSDDSPLEDLTITAVLIGELDGGLYPFLDENEPVQLFGKGYYRLYITVVDPEGNMGYAYYRILSE